MTAAPTLDDIHALAEAAVAQLPAPFAEAAREVALVVEDWPAADVLREMEIEDPLELTGLYDGIPLTEKSVFDQPMRPDTVWLYRRPILDELASRPGETLERLVTHIVVHEFAHHFGWSDDDIAVIDPWWE
ncbi:metallopeptidase family protein [Pseudaestuariivita sp.]|uniref:metallopeptidase family protein n=1 Tax=Pseudaestuariivita sp. TaxID=2211669 RepID=UPI0040597CFC